MHILNTKLINKTCCGFLGQTWDEKIIMSTTDYGRPVRKSASLHGWKSTPTPKFSGTAKAYFVCHIGPNFQIFFDLCLHWVSVVYGLDSKTYIYCGKNIQGLAKLDVVFFFCTWPLISSSVQTWGQLASYSSVRRFTTYILLPILLLI